MQCSGETSQGTNTTSVVRCDAGTGGQAVSGESDMSRGDLIRPVKQMSGCRPGICALSSGECAPLKGDVHGS